MVGYCECGNEPQGSVVYSIFGLAENVLAS